MNHSNNTPLVSVIIPTYNHAKYIRACIQSVIDQTYANWEIMVINNFSNDDTIGIVNSFSDPRINLINFKNNGIIAASRNEGIRQAKGEYIAFLDSDDLWYKNKLSECVKALDTADIVYHNLNIFNKNKTFMFKKLKGRKLKNPVFIDLMLNGNTLPNSSVVLKKYLIDKVGFITEDPRLVGVEDFDFWIRISKITDRFSFISKYLGNYWLGEDNTTMVSDLHIIKHRYLYQRYISLLNKQQRKEHLLFRSYFFGIMKYETKKYTNAIRLLKNGLRQKKLKIKIKCFLYLIKSYWSLVLN